WTPGDALSPGPYQVQEPSADRPVLQPNVILVPTLGYTAQADRLGYGGGYYDRTLAALRDAGHDYTAIGVAWNEGLLDVGYRPAAHDVRLDAVLTPDGWVPPPPVLGPDAPTGGTFGSYVLRCADRRRPAGARVPAPCPPYPVCLPMPGMRQIRPLPRLLPCPGSDAL